MRRREHKGDERGDAYEAKAKGDQGVLFGHASKWWVVDSYGECTAPGCFANTIAERGPQGADRTLYRYEHEITVGKPTVLKEDADGLYIEAKISDDGMWGTALRKQLADGVPYGQSIGWRRVGYRSATDQDPLIFDHAPSWAKQVPRGELIVLTEVKLPEVSAVSLPAVDNALVEGFRSEQPTQRLRLLRSLLPGLKAGDLSDDDIAALKQFLGARLADGRDGEGETPDPAPTTQTVKRNRSAEVALLFAQARQMGIDIDGVAA